VDSSIVYILSVLLLALSFGPLVTPVYAEEVSEKTSTRPADEDEDEPDYYEGQDAPTAEAANVEAIANQGHDAETEAQTENVQSQLWMEITENGYFSLREDKKIFASSTFRIGKRFRLLFPLDIYAQGRFDRDQRNIEWTNHVDAGAGLRLTLSKTIPLTLSAEIVGGEYLRSSLVSIAPEKGQGIASGFFVEGRAGLTADYTWGRLGESIYAEPPWFSFPFRFWGEGRSSLLYSNLNRREYTPWMMDGSSHINQYQGFTAIFHPDAGVLIMEGLAGNLAAYCTMQVRLNTLGDWWNDLATIGPGFSYQPLQSIDLFLKVEYLTGQYFWKGRPGAYRPYEKGIHDLRINLDLKYALGI
jgi:hypothetical protein